MFIASRLVMLSLAAWLHLPLSAYADDAAGSPAQWPNLSDYFKATTDEMELMNTRGFGFFWDPTKAPGFDLDIVKQFLSGREADCAVIVYYDRLQSRIKEKDSGSGLMNSDGVFSYEWPLAIAPICQNDTQQTNASEYPASTSDNVTMVFWGAHSNTSQDLYLVIPIEKPFYLPYENDTSYMADVKAAGYNFDCVGLKRELPGLLWGDSHETQDGDRYIGFEVMDWLLHYEAYAGRQLPGCVPNPYVIGKGDRSWPAFTGDDFYGYDEEGKRISLANRHT
ncbi:hypothetical protein FFLO_03242 [Filobasidium floriforme]|uniref:Uncharacterized protein n=1 Tax=Filobasidium floriforme TaxID=5210 RepID=A0A8K0JRE9_9TREE|nr:hypothetical protein FFLO_03242 [Filobasidium floriforme]